MKIPKTVGVIGANGMLGSDLVAFLSRRFTVLAITKENYHSFIGKTFDVLINANGNSKRFWANTHPFEDFLASTVSVYKSLFDFHYGKYIYISSSDVYLNHSNSKSTSENQIIKPNALSPYGFHKYLSEMFVRQYAKKYIILRCSMMLGKHLKKGPLYDLLNNKALYISHSSKLQMITTVEVAKIIFFLINKERSGETFNVGGIGTFSFNKIKNYFKNAHFQRKTEKQLYEMNVIKLGRLHSLKTSEIYFEEFLKNL